jgi:hypothetical protein
LQREIAGGLAFCWGLKSRAAGGLSDSGGDTAECKKHGGYTGKIESN